jgi:hypothetical protein
VHTPASGKNATLFVNSVLRVLLHILLRVLRR